MDEELKETNPAMPENACAEETRPADGSEGTMSEGAHSETVETAGENKEAAGENGAAARKGKFRAWWEKHRPTKRRLIQVYAALLFNANIKGFVTGEIYSGAAKYLCVPGLNCYSCPGAVGACPLGALQNALAASNTRAPYYVFGIIILFGILFARSVCGFLCPVGLGQELLYKIKTPKLRKSKVTYILSYFKYVLLATLVVAVPLAYSETLPIPSFCKYVCPAGTFGGALGLLVNPANDVLYGMLGGLFTWKFVVLVLVIAACMFIFRFFCRFLCPLGAIYGFFNKIALLGVKLDKNKCTDCGLCVSFCKMDIRKVGDHECINCGECIGVCPAKAISWKGSKLFVHPNATETPVAEKPLAGLLNNAEAASSAENGVPMSEAVPQKTQTAPKKRRYQKAFCLRIGACALAGCVLAGAFVYFNAFDGVAAASGSADYLIEIASLDGKGGTMTFTIEGKESGDVSMRGGTGTKEDPYLIEHFAGKYIIPLQGDAPIYFLYTAHEEQSYTVHAEGIRMAVYYRAGGEDIPYYDLQSGNTFTLTPSPDAGTVYGNQVGDILYDFTVDLYGGGGAFRLSEHRGCIVIINFWYTSCTPCVSEMPHFDDIAREYEGRVTVVAIHSAMITAQPATREGVQAWLDSTLLIGKTHTWSSSPILFAQDSGRSLTDSETYRLLGGRGPYPMTLIVDGEGIVRYRPAGAVTYGDLKAAVDALLAE